MHSLESISYRVAIPKTVDGNGIADAIADELEGLGHRTVFFPIEKTFPPEAEVVFLFGPFGKFLHLPARAEGLSRSKKPTFVYWNTEGLPDLRLPWGVVGPASAARSWLGRAAASPAGLERRLAGLPPLSWAERRFVRFRYMGDYLYARRKGWIDVFADISQVYAEYFQKRGIPALAAPFGSYKGWYADLGLERDIDVLWMGKRSSKRRSAALDRLRAELRALGVDIYMVDNIERPFVFDDERTRLLNRAKITLNLLRTWYDENSLRICLASPNRSLVVSEPLLPHVPQYQPGVHYVSAPIPELAQTILKYLQDDARREQIVANAYELSTREVTFANSMRTIMSAAAQARQGLPARPAVEAEEQPAQERQ